MNRRTLFAALTSVAAFSLAAAAAAQTPDDYPNRPIRIIVPQAAGSGVDQQARVLAQKMGELWGQQGVVESPICLPISATGIVQSFCRMSRILRSILSSMGIPIIFLRDWSIASKPFS